MSFHWSRTTFEYIPGQQQQGNHTNISILASRHSEGYSGVYNELQRMTNWSESAPQDWNPSAFAPKNMHKVVTASHIFYSTQTDQTSKNNTLTQCHTPRNIFANCNAWRKAMRMTESRQFKETTKEKTTSLEHVKTCWEEEEDTHKSFPLTWLQSKWFRVDIRKNLSAGKNN